MTVYVHFQSPGIKALGKKTINEINCREEVTRVFQVLMCNRLLHHILMKHHPIEEYISELTQNIAGDTSKLKKFEDFYQKKFNEFAHMAEEYEAPEDSCFSYNNEEFEILVCNILANFKPFGFYVGYDKLFKDLDRKLDAALADKDCPERDINISFLVEEHIKNALSKQIRQNAECNSARCFSTGFSNIGVITPILVQ